MAQCGPGGGVNRNVCVRERVRENTAMERTEQISGRHEGENFRKRTKKKKTNLFVLYRCGSERLVLHRSWLMVTLEGKW